MYEIPYPNQHAVRVEDPGTFIKESFRTKEISPGISLILGKKSEGGSMETQAYRFDSDKFTEEQVKDWLKEHDIKGTFEKAVDVDNISEINNADDGTWITINGAHILLKDGEDVDAAFKRTTGKSLRSSKGGEISKGKYTETGNKVNRLSTTGEDVEPVNMADYHAKVAARKGYVGKTTDDLTTVTMRVGGSTPDVQAQFEEKAKSDPEHYKIATGPAEKSGASVAWAKTLEDPGFKSSALAKAKEDKDFWKKLGVGNLTPIDNEGSFILPHDITLQRLDTLLPYPGVKSGKLKYSIDNYSGTEREWDKALAVFVPPGAPIQHVDHAAFVRDPQGEARRLGYRIAGHHAQTKVISTGPGEPRAITQAIFDDPEADQYAREGKLSVSSGFDANVHPDGYMTGKVVPNHVLYFLRNEKTAFGTQATPNDPGAMVNNLSEQSDPKQEKDMDEPEKGMLTKVHDILTGTTKTEIDALKTQIANLEVQNVDKQTAIDALKAEIGTMKTALAEKEAKLAEMDNLAKDIETQKKNARWQEIKNLYQPGMFHKPEDEKQHRESFDKDPAGFMLANIGNLSKEPVKAKAQGSTSSIGNVGDDAKIDVRAAVGFYDAQSNSMKPIGGQ